MEQDDPVTPDEYILRRVLNRNDYINWSLSEPVTKAALSPTREDAVGISVYRELFATPEQVAADGPSGDGYYVVRILAANIFNLGLSIVPNPLNPGLAGHCLIPELGGDAKAADVTAYRATSRSVIRTITHNNIVFDPNA